MNSVNSLVEYQINNSYIFGVVIVSAILCLCLLYNMIKFDTNAFKKSLSRKFKKAIDTFIYEKDKKLEAVIEKNNLPAKLNLFLYDIKIDLELFKDATLYQFKLIIYAISFLISVSIGLFVFSNILTVLFLFPLIYIAVVSMLFFNIVNKKRQRLLDIITTENLLSIEMNRGFDTVVRDNINNIPASVRDSYNNYLINKERLNYSSEEALHKLRIELGTYSWNFLSKVNLYENYRETESDVEMFKDIVILNQIRLRGYNEVDKVVRSVRSSFWVAIGMSVILWILEFIAIKAVRWFYLSFFVGQILLILNILLLILVNLRLQILNSEEL